MSKHKTDDGALELLGQLMDAQLSETHAATNRVIEALTYDRDRARAELLAVQEAVCGLLDSGWMPTSESLRAAVLFPSEERIQQLMPQPEEQEQA